MSGDRIMEAIGYIGDDLVEKHLSMRASLRQRGTVPLLWRRRLLAVACAAVLLFGGLVGYQAYLSYGVEYTVHVDAGSEEKTVLKRNTPIYYVSASGRIRRSSVRMYGGYMDKFVVWRHLNGIGDEVTVTVKHYDGGALYDGTRLIGSTSGGYRVSVMTVSANIKEYGHYEKLMRSLEKTMRGGSADFFLMIEE
ncbi:MAG: hypothetical protein IJX39_00675 [Clostridia bacterium]|nr:hypothetical protein [Clostridia bacterium]